MNPNHILSSPKGNFFREADGAGGGGGPESNAGASSETAAVGFAAEDGSFVEGWTSRLPEDLGEARDKFSKFKTVSDLAKSYHSLEQTLGSRAGAVVVPGERSTPEEVSAFRRALGVPERVEDYNIRPEKLPEGMEWNNEAARPYVELAHKYNIPPAAMKELVARHAESEAQRGQVIAEMAQAQLESGKRALQSAWGDEYGTKIDLATRAAKTAGVDPRSSGFTDPEVVKAFARLGEMISDDKLVGGGSGYGALQGGAARARDIQTNPHNPLYQKYQDGDADTVGIVREMLRRG